MKIVLNHLTKIFPNRNKKGKGDVIAVNDFDFEIPDGKLVGLLGPSGCGKSTTLNLISGLLMPSKGTIFFGDKEVTLLPAEYRDVGLVFQSYALYPHLNVRQNIIFPLENLKGDKKLTKEQMNEKALEVAKLVQIDELMDRKPSELSGGQQQRVAIARALVKMPKVLLLDEPLSNLDARLRLQTREELRRIQRKTGITTIFVTHDQEEAMSISDLIVVMKDGLVQQIDEPQKVYDDPVNLFVAKFLGTPPINVFTGKVKEGKLYIGEDAVLDVKLTEVSESKDGSDVNDSKKSKDASESKDSERQVFIGIRPEGFVLQEDGPLCLNLDRVEIMGRDKSVVSTHDCCQNALIRSIIPSECVVDTSLRTVHFALKPSKVLLFDAKTEERIHFREA